LYMSKCLIRRVCGEIACKNNVKTKISMLPNFFKRF
jgi:hypothetical protein